MNDKMISCIDELVFMKRKNLFQVPDVILYHPGHFPELNDQLFSYYRQFGAKKIMIPDTFNSFLNSSEFKYYRPLLIEKGMKEELLAPIPVNETKDGVEGVIQSAFNVINESDYKNILLAGKSFFSRRFYMLASIYANKDIQLDILPLEDNRAIVPREWNKTEKGMQRVINELEQYVKISKANLQ